MDEGSPSTSFLDRPAARYLAGLIFVLCGALLAFVHRDDLRTFAGADRAPEADKVTTDPAAPCIEQRFAEIDGMIEEGVVGEEQAAMFKQRAEAMCRATEGDGARAPLPMPAE